VGGRRGEDAHAEHGDGAEEAGDGVGDLQVLLDLGDKRPHADELRPQGEGGEEEAPEQGNTATVPRGSRRRHGQRS
jgi:hypothetical protein